ncbi:MAG TPA: hypothetical protein VF623_06965 [Segetibacter sp.]
MKKLTTGTTALLVAAVVTMYSCGGPNDDQGGMDSKNSNEGEIDSSRLVKSDTTSAYIATPDFIKAKNNFGKRSKS